MNNHRLLVAVAALSLCGEAIAETQIERVSLFKNGVAMIELKADVPAEGDLELEDVPSPIHGTFWVNGESPVTAKVQMRDVATSFTAFSKQELMQHIGGQDVELTLSSGRIVKGRVLATEKPKEQTWGKDYATQQGRPYYYGTIWGGNYTSTPVPQPSQQMVYLETPGQGLAGIDAAEIKEIHFPTAPTPTRQQPVLILDSAEDKATKAQVGYLANGLSWAPSYLVDITDQGSLLVRQKAVVRNELAALRNTEVRVISGFPSIKFSAVESPMAASTTWQNFFQKLVQLDQATAQGNASIVSNAGNFAQIGHGGRVDLGSSAPVMTPEEGASGSVDLHYQSLGRHELGLGESLAVEVAKAEAEYERIVDWKVPDSRDQYGRPIDDYQRQRYPDKYDQEAWDAVLFRNPFEFPMTTAPVMIVEKGDFQGQQQVTWTNPGEELTARINKALSVSTSYFEIEDEGSRQQVKLYGRNYYRTQVTGEIELTNYRNAPINMRIVREFSGELLRADEEPKAQLLEKGVYSINPRRELTWRIDLKPGENRKLTYGYEVLVRN